MKFLIPLLLLASAIALGAQTCPSGVTDCTTLTWNPGSGGGTVQTYEIFRSTTSTVSTTTAYATVTAASACTISGSTTTCTYTDSSVVEGTEYWYEIEACNTSACSSPTAAVSFTIPFQAPSTPTNLTITGK